MEVKEQLFLSEYKSNEMYTLIFLCHMLSLGVNLISDQLLLRGYFPSALS